MIDTTAEFKFFTGMTLLDVDGGTKLVQDMTYPSRVLVMGPAGEMYIRNDTDDKPYVESHRMIFEKTTDNVVASGDRSARRAGWPGSAASTSPLAPRC